MRGKVNLLRWPVCVLFLLLALCTAATGEVIYVDDDAAGANNGSSWSEAFTDLQDALVAALEGDEIHVAEGIYTPTQNPLDREATFDLKDGVTIIGGYAGLAGMYPDFSHTKHFMTILSGDIDHNDDGIDPNSKDGNSSHVVTCTGEGNAAVLEGVTITRGYSSYGVVHGNRGKGGGLYCQGGSPQLIDCIFTDNYAWGGGGGAVHVSSGSYPVFTRCIWEDNDARIGGAIYTSRRSSLNLNYCIFRRNTAGLKGGAIYTDLGSQIRIVNCLFVANTANDTGGAISCPDATNGNGDSLFNLVNCTFYGNSSPTFHKPPTNSVIQPDNSRLRSSGSVITNCIFYNSIANEESEVPVTFEFGREEPLIVTSIYEKESGQGGAIPPTPDPLFVDSYGADGILGTEDDNFRLAPGSPAIDSGTNETDPQLPAMDFDGNPRILNDIIDLGAYEFTGLF